MISPESSCAEMANHLLAELSCETAVARVLGHEAPNMVDASSAGPDLLAPSVRHRSERPGCPLSGSAGGSAPPRPAHGLARSDHARRPAASLAAGAQLQCRSDRRVGCRSTDASPLRNWAACLSYGRSPRPSCRACARCTCAPHHVKRFTVYQVHLDLESPSLGSAYFSARTMFDHDSDGVMRVGVWARDKDRRADAERQKNSFRRPRPSRGSVGRPAPDPRGEGTTLAPLCSENALNLVLKQSPAARAS